MLLMWNFNDSLMKLSAHKTLLSSGIHSVASLGWCHPGRQLMGVTLFLLEKKSSGDLFSHRLSRLLTTPIFPGRL